MKRRFVLIASVVALVLAVNTLSALAKDKSVKLTGEAKCAKCMLKEGTACQTVIQVEKKGQTTTYYVVDNDVSKGFHSATCGTSARRIRR